MAFNLVVVDGTFYCTRVLVHIQKYGKNIDKLTFQEGVSLLLSFLFLQLLLIDMIRLFWAGESLKVSNSEFHQDHIQLIQKQMCDSIIKSVLEKSAITQDSVLDESKAKLELQNSFDKKVHKKEHNFNKLQKNKIAPLEKKNEVVKPQGQPLISGDWKNLLITDEEKTILNSHINPHHILFVQDGLIENKNAYTSCLVYSFRFYFLLKTTLFQILLVTLPYSPQIQVLTIIGLELFNVIATWVKYKAVKHLVNKVSMTQTIGQSCILIVFLCLVFGMTTKAFKYGNGSTSGSLELGYWQAGQNIGMLLVSVAVLAELLLYLAGMVTMIKGIINMLIDLCVNESTKHSKFEDSVKQHVKYYKAGIFFKTLQLDQNISGNLSASQGSQNEEKPSQKSKEKIETVSPNKLSENGPSQKRLSLQNDKIKMRKRKMQVKSKAPDLFKSKSKSNNFTDEVGANQQG